MCFRHVLFTVVSPNSLRFRCGVLRENGSSRLSPMGDDVPTDPVCIARPTPQARRAPQVQIPNTQHPILAIGRASYSEVGPSLPIPSGSPSPIPLYGAHNCQIWRSGLFFA